MKLTNRDLIDLTGLRRDLHRHPEVSGQERETARRIAEALQGSAPDRILTDLGGHGVAAIFEGDAPGPTVLLRCELDGLPIRETGDAAHRSLAPGKGHLCGHDGHMAIVTGMARLLGRERPAKGRVILMYQPAEEDGSGAAAVIADPRFAQIAPDWCFALHNMPGLPFGHAMLGAGPVNCASRGLRIGLGGRTAHASQPETGLSPMACLARLMPALTALGSAPDAPPDDFTLVTVTHARLGEPAFGIAPGAAELWVTLRTLVDDRMDALVRRAETLVALEAGKDGLAVTLDYHDIFAHCHNDPDATDILRHAAAGAGLTHGPEGLPMRASEDFGRFGQHARSAMLFLGAGETTPALHNPDYDFPDDLIGIGVRIFTGALVQLGMIRPD